MKLTILQNIVFAGKAFAAGKIVELDDATAKRFVKANFASADADDQGAGEDIAPATKPAKQAKGKKAAKK